MQYLEIGAKEVILNICREVTPKVFIALPLKKKKKNEPRNWLCSFSSCHQPTWVMTWHLIHCGELPAHLVSNGEFAKDYVGEMEKRL